MPHTHNTQQDNEIPGNVITSIPNKSHPRSALQIQIISFIVNRFKFPAPLHLKDKRVKSPWNLIKSNIMS